jgi:hypothetical protein
MRLGRRDRDLLSFRLQPHMTTVEGGTFGVRAVDAAAHPEPTMRVTFGDGRRPAEPTDHGPTTARPTCLNEGTEPVKERVNELRYRSIEALEARDALTLRRASRRSRWYASLYSVRGGGECD